MNGVSTSIVKNENDLMNAAKEGEYPSEIFLKV
jgi:hypothetical protein